MLFSGGDGENRSVASFVCFANLSHLYVPFASQKMDNAVSIPAYKRKNLGENRGFSIGGAGVIKDEHPSILLFSPSKAASISSSGILSMLKDFLLALIIKVKWSSYK